MSSLAKKYIMALSGLVLVGFACGHMVGNLQMFLHPDWINEYAYKLQHLPYGLLWVVRLVLLICVVAHIVTAIMLVIENKKARPTGYAVKTSLQASFASKTMRYSGIILLAFIVYHLMHYTVQSTNPEFKELHTPILGVESHGMMESRTIWGVYDKLSAHGEFPDSPALNVHDVYSMVAIGFGNPLVSGFYILSMVLLCLHLSHGISSMFQSLGLRNAIWRKRLNKVALAIALVVFIGFTSIPVAVLAGMIEPLPTALSSVHP